MPRSPHAPPVHRREQILDEAQRLLVAHGLHQVSTRQIAEAVGISQPSLYAHFPTREAIVVELCCRAFAKLQDRLARAAAEPGDPAARLYRLGCEYVDFGLTHEAAYRVAFMLELPPEPAPQKKLVLAAGLKAFAIMRSVFDDMDGDMGDDTAAADMAAQSAWAGMHGLVSLLLARTEFPWVEKTRLIDFHLRRICAVALSPVN